MKTLLFVEILKYAGQNLIQVPQINCGLFDGAIVELVFLYPLYHDYFGINRLVFGFFPKKYIGTRDCSHVCLMGVAHKTKMIQIVFEV